MKKNIILFFILALLPTLTLTAGNNQKNNHTSLDKSAKYEKIAGSYEKKAGKYRTMAVKSKNSTKKQYYNSMAENYNATAVQKKRIAHAYKTDNKKSFKEAMEECSKLKKSRKQLKLQKKKNSKDISRNKSLSYGHSVKIGSLQRLQEL